MGNGKYIRCRNCETINHVSSFDRAPSYQIAAGEIHKIPANDWQDFMGQHAGHKLEPLTASGSNYFPGGSADVTLFREIVSELDPKSVRPEEFHTATITFVTVNWTPRPWTL